MTTDQTKLREQITAALELVIEVGKVIKELRTVPSGVLYAQLQGVMSLQSYAILIDKLIELKLVRRDRMHLLTWIGDDDASQTAARPTQTE